MLEPSHNNELPAIPGKRYFTIGEVSELCAVKPHVLRYWEQEFPQLKPVKRRGNRRYYQREDVLTIRQIRALLYDEGYTIGGARQRMTDEKARGVHPKPDQRRDPGNHRGPRGTPARRRRHAASCFAEARQVAGAGIVIRDGNFTLHGHECTRTSRMPGAKYIYIYACINIIAVSFPVRTISDGRSRAVPEMPC
jgi:DNA-binding transcriptional MerR regulator